MVVAPDPISFLRDVLETKVVLNGKANWNLSRSGLTSHTMRYNLKHVSIGSTQRSV